MQFTPIDLSTWPRREHFHYYRNQLPCGYSVTVQLDVTRFRAMLERKGLKFYPSFICLAILITQIWNKSALHAHSRTGLSV